MTDRFSGITEFLAVARLGSFTAAGASIGLTKSAISKAITKLENRLGARLFHRTTRKLSLTADGQSFLAVCASMSSDLAGFEETVGAGQSRPTGRLRIDLPSAFGRMYVVPVLVELMADYPELTVSASFSDRRVDLIEDGIDIAVRIGAPPDATDVVARQLGVQTLVVCASPAYIERYGSPTSREELALHRCIVGRRNQTRHAWLLRNTDGTSERYPVNGHHELEDGDAMLAAAVAGLGLAQLPTWLAHEQFRNGTLVEVLEGQSGGEVPVSAIRVKGGNMPIRIRAALDKLAHALSKHEVLRPR